MKNLYFKLTSLVISLIALAACSSPTAPTSAAPVNSPIAAGIPYAPKSLTTGASSRALVEATSNSFQGTNWGVLIFVWQVAHNYNSALDGYKAIMSSKGSSFTAISQAGYTRKYTGTRSDYINNYVLYTNDDETKVCLVYTNSYDAEIRQIDYTHTETENYGRVIFWRKNVDDMIDITEVFETSNAKDINTARAYNISTSPMLVQAIARTEMASGHEKTTAIVDFDSQLAGYVAGQSTNLRIGIIDLTMTNAKCGTLDADGAALPTGFPLAGDVIAIRTKMLTPTQAKTITITTNPLERYAGFD
jgi:hypothetical protein